MKRYIDKDAVVAEIKKYIYRCNEKKRSCPVNTQVEAICDNKINAYNEILSFIDTLEVTECEAKSGIIQKDLQIILDDGTYIDLDPSMQLKPSFSVKEGERVKVVIFKLGMAVNNNT